MSCPFFLSPVPNDSEPFEEIRFATKLVQSALSVEEKKHRKAARPTTEDGARFLDLFVLKDTFGKHKDGFTMKKRCLHSQQTETETGRVRMSVKCFKIYGSNYTPHGAMAAGSWWSFPPALR